MIRDLENSEVSSVIFIRDYLQLYFEGDRRCGTLTAYSLPKSIVCGREFDHSTPGYRDSLCSFISHQVKRSEMEEWKIKLVFDNDDRLEIPLHQDQELGLESAMLRIDDEILIW
ncbi:hypothetical protein AM500_05615 [Bacillus sp. FJAT-18017]|uniref:hypothetical protein n=1 Tax=Bacillus sp. FJAT-18017 TaxID=1705566 RepID=UPI0006B00BE9|nr:hypothetical protein [Bacillus sp. FJAT-18017]ALC89322.1 hypothetical protein AM500_05615 [Bacillus sp. FJAT-18017]